MIIELSAKRISASLIRPSNTTQYTAGDVIAEVTTNNHFTFGSVSTLDGGSKKVSREPGGMVEIVGARLVSSANQSTKLDAELWLFRADPAEVGDNAALALSDSEMDNHVGTIDFPIAYWKVGNAASGASGNAVCQPPMLPLLCRTSDQGLLYGVLVARNGYTPVSGETFSIVIQAIQHG